MDTHQRIAQRVLAEHSAIAERLRLNAGAVLDYALRNVDRWSREFPPGNRPGWLVEWERLLTGPMDALITVLTDDTGAAAQLRKTSPFVGLLTFQERLEILHRVDPEMARALEAFASSWDERFPPAEELAGR